MQQTPHRHTMPTVFFRIFHLYNLVNSLLLHLLPKRIAALLPNSSLSNTHQPIPQGIKPSSSSSPALSSVSAPRMNMAELQHVFRMFDRNGDGQITKEELSESLENLGIYIPDKDLVAMIEKIDENGDGCVDMSEFHLLYEMIMDERDEEEDMREAFNVFDQDADGFISVEELRSVLGSLGLKQGEKVEDCRKMVGKVDVDGDGMVNFMEFKEMMRGGGFASLSSSSS